MDAVYELKEMLCNKLEEIGKMMKKQKQMPSPADVAYIGDLARAVKDLGKVIVMYEGEYSHEYSHDYSRDYSSESSQAGTWRGEMTGEYGDRSSQRRHRDRMGRYSSRDGYSHEGDDLISQLEEKMHNTKNERDKDNIRRCIDSMKKM